MSKTRKALLTLIALGLLTQPIKLLLAAILPDASVNPVPGWSAGMALTLLTLGLPAWRLRPWTGARLLQPKTLLPEFVLAVLAAITVRFGFRIVDEVWQGWLGLAPAVLSAPESMPLGMLCLAATVVVPALAEEAFFRGALLTGLLDGSRRITAVLLTTLSFVLLHGNIANLPSLLVLSALLTLLMLHGGHIAVPMTAHFIYNLTALGGVAVPEWAGLMCCGAAVVLGGYLLADQPDIAHPPMKRADGLIAAATMAALILSYLI